MTNTLLSFGHGYSATALSHLLQAQQWSILGTTRDPQKVGALRLQGITPLIWPGDNIKNALAQATHLLISTAPDENGDPVLADFSNEIANAAPHIEWVGYLSTTGVYGDHQGDWVDENTPLTPTTERGRKRVVAEKQWRDFACKTSLTLQIFRLAGIYGPGRGPFAKVKNGSARRIIKPGQVFSRIHVDDIAQTLFASFANPNPGAIYNLCDDEPAPPEDVIAYAAELLNKPVPPAILWDDADMTPMARSFYAESKKVRNDRIKSELGITLKYPDYRSGLQAILNKA